MNRNLTGARGINQMLQEALNPPDERDIEKFGYRFSVADKVCRLTTGTTRTSKTATLDLCPHRC